MMRRRRKKKQGVRVTVEVADVWGEKVEDGEGSGWRCVCAEGQRNKGEKKKRQGEMRNKKRGGAEGGRGDETEMVMVIECTGATFKSGNLSEVKSQTE